jgi:hypothetical protein
MAEYGGLECLFYGFELMYLCDGALLSPYVLPSHLSFPGITLM